MTEPTTVELYEKQQKQAIANRKKRASQLKKLTDEQAAILAATDMAGIQAAVAHLSAGDRGALHRAITARMDAIVG